MNIDRIIYLLDRRKNNLASNAEQIELAALIRTGLYDEIIQDEINKDFSSSIANAKPFDKKLFNTENVLEKILINENNTMEEVQNSFWPQPRTSWIAAAVIVFALGFGWFTSNKRPQVETFVSNTTDTDNLIKSNTNKRLVVLPDGSTVILNADSELTYSGSFSQKRAVSLVGEAFFDIQKDPAHPFTVQTGEVTTTVLGTAFNINANETNVKVTVERGLVQVGSNNQVFAKIKPKEAIQVDNKTLKFQLEKVENSVEAEWRNQLLVINELSMEKTMELLEKRFHKKITITNPLIKKCRISAHFINEEPLEDILTVICGSRQASYQIGPKNTITINGGLSCN